nr:transposase [Lederbergia citrea]
MFQRRILSICASSKVSKFTQHGQPKVFILDDSSFDRNRGPHVELLARCFDHASQKMRFYKGFYMLTLGWSDGMNFMPVDFSLLSAKKAK